MNPSSIWLAALRARSRFRHNPDREAWVIAWALALMLHAAIILVLVKFPMVSLSVAAPQPVRVRLFSERPQTATQEPHFFSELPPDRADKAPEKPEFLSNVTSRARDRVSGGRDDLPRMEGVGDVPMVNLEPGGHSSPAPSKRAQKVVQPQAQSLEGFRRKGEAEGAEAGMALPNPLRLESPTPTPSPALDPSKGSGGNSDIPQPEMDNPQGNAGLMGDVSLSTTAWDYAPWLQRFGRKLMDRWIAPTAYIMGLLKEGGWTVVELRIARSGEVLRFQPLENQGHSSLIIAAQSALRNTEPLERLPADFPDSTLILRVRMTYPKIP